MEDVRVTEESDRQLSSLFYRCIDSSHGGADVRTVIVLHGMYSSSSNWYPLFRQVADRARLRVYLVDLPNHGRSPWSQTVCYEETCADVERWIEQQHFEGAVTLVGHSFGARVALVLAARMACVEAVAMIDMSPFVEPKADRVISLWHAILLGRMVEAQERGVEDVDAYLRENNIEGQVALSMAVPYKQMNIRAARDSVRQLGREYKAIKDDEFWSAVRRLRMLVIRGGDSHYVPRDTERLMAERFDDWRVVTIPGATHDVHYSRPADLVTELVDFLESGN